MTLETDTNHSFSQLVRMHKEWLEKLRAEAFAAGKQFGWQAGNEHGHKKGLICGRRRGHVAGAWEVLMELSEEERKRVCDVMGMPYKGSQTDASMGA